MHKFTKHEAFHFTLFLTVLLAGAVFLDAMSQDDDSITGDASLKKLRKKIKKELERIENKIEGEKPKPTPPPQQAVSPTPAGQVPKLTTTVLDTHPAQNIIGAGQMGVKLLAIEFTAPPNEDIVINDLTILDTVAGLASVSNDLKNFALKTLDAQQVGPTVPVITPERPGLPPAARFTNLKFIIPKNQKRILYVQADTSQTPSTAKHSIELGGYSAAVHPVHTSLQTNWHEMTQRTGKIFTIQQTTSQTPQITENAFLTLFQRLSTKEGAQIDINAVPPDKPFRPTFKIQHQGTKEYRPMYTIEVIDKNNQVLYKKSYGAQLLKENEWVEMTEVISADDAYGKNLKLIPGEFYTIKVSISQKQGETNLADNEQKITFKTGQPTIQPTIRLKEASERPRATYSTQPSTRTVILPQEVGV